MNKVILMGRLANDVEMRYTESLEPMAIARYTLAVPKQSKTKDGNDADFLRCVAFGKCAEFASKYLRKGVKIAVCGSIHVEKYTDKNGNNAYATNIIVREHYFAESKKNYENNEKENESKDGFMDVSEKDIEDFPF